MESSSVRSFIHDSFLHTNLALLPTTLFLSTDMIWIKIAPLPTCHVISATHFAPGGEGDLSEEHRHTIPCPPPLYSPLKSHSHEEKPLSPHKAPSSPSTPAWPLTEGPGLGTLRQPSPSPHGQAPALLPPLLYPTVRSLCLIRVERTPTPGYLSRPSSSSILMTHNPPPP